MKPKKNGVKSAAQKPVIGLPKNWGVIRMGKIKISILDGKEIFIGDGREAGVFPLGKFKKCIEQFFKEEF
jgi:hypothetical protein